jgi:hypothetical protein
MTFEEAKEQAQQGIKIRHQYFAEKEYMTMKGNLIVFEDVCEIFANDWLGDKQWALDGWSLYVA